MTTETEIQTETNKETYNIPVRPPKSARIILNLNYAENRMDNILLKALREQEDNANLKIISRGALKVLFNEGKILIKGQRAKSSSALAKGTTYVDILGH
jgi:hypothetical protein